jgi:hypothetical protein
MKLDHSVIPVKKVLTVEDGLENPLTGVAIYLLRNRFFENSVSAEKFAGKFMSRNNS